MSAVILSSKGQLVLPAGVRQRFGLGTGSRLELIEESDGIRLVVPHVAPTADVESGYGMLKPRSKGKPRRLQEFDAAAVLRRPAAEDTKP